MRHIVIIGLGNLGFYLGQELTSKGFDVLGIDKEKDVVQRAKTDIAQAVLADATDKDTLLALGIGATELAVVTIGTNMLASILATFHLKEIGVKEVYAKALSSEHERILRRIGADRILFPEKDLALSLARRIANPNMLEYLPFIEDHGIFELGPPESFVGKTLRDLDLINRYGIQVIAIRDGRSGNLIFIPKADFVIREADVLILLGPNTALDQLSKESDES